MSRRKQYGTGRIIRIVECAECLDDFKMEEHLYKSGTMREWLKRMGWGQLVLGGIRRWVCEICWMRIVDRRVENEFKKVRK